MPKLVVMLRVKDSMTFVEEWLERTAPLVDEIIALDNGSSDGTYEALAAHPKVVDLVRTEGYNEGRDKKLLYERVRLRKPDWILWIDIDEIFEPGLSRKDFDRLMSRSFVNKYAFRRFHFTDREHFAGSWFRLNYSAGHDRMLWREQPGGYFEDFILDSPNVKGISGLKVYTNFRLKHLGYINKDLVDTKAAIYRKVIAKEKEASLDQMYMKNEKPIRWVDNRNSLQVVALNGLLNLLLAKQLGMKAYHKLRSKLFSKKSSAITSTELSKSA